MRATKGSRSSLRDSKDSTMKLLPGLALTLALLCPASATVRTNSECAGAAEPATCTVDFVSGAELQKQTSDRSIVPTAGYAVVWLDPTRSVVVKLDGVFFPSQSSPAQVPLGRTFHGRSPDGTAWKVTPTVYAEGATVSAAQKTVQEEKAAKVPVTGALYPNGKPMRRDLAYLYPNGRAVGAIGDWVYPNGKAIRSIGRDYYPNGRQAISQGEPFYPNGNKVRKGSGYLSPEGTPLDAPPPSVQLVDGEWTYTIPLGTTGLPRVDNFHATMKTAQGEISITFLNGMITDVRAR